MRQIILDTETTGLDPKFGHRIIEIGCVEVIDKVKTGKTFQTYINPERNVPVEAFNVHKISTEFLRDKPKFQDIAKPFMDFIADSELIIHNAGFDLGFIKSELLRCNLALRNSYIDTLEIARRKFPGSAANLNALCRRFNISLKNRDELGHGALLDAELLYHVYICLVEGIQSKINMSNKEDSASKQKRKVEPRDFVYADDFTEHEAFIKGMPNAMWRKL